MTRRTTFRPRSRLARRAAVLLAATATFSVSLLSTSALLPQSQAATLTTVVASADAKVQADTPDTNYGTTTSLAARGPSSTSPQQRSYIQVTVSGLSGRPASARLDLYSYAVSTTGVQVSTAGNGWTETGITWSNKPAAATVPLADVGKVAAGTWVEYDVTSLVHGDGTISLGVVSTNSDGADYTSSEGSSSSVPQLVVTTN
jgi:hypothetical protein